MQHSDLKSDKTLHFYAQNTPKDKPFRAEGMAGLEPPLGEYITSEKIANFNYLTPVYRHTMHLSSFKSERPLNFSS